MQTKLALRARRLLVGAGVITVVVTALAPAAVSAAQPDLPPQALEHQGRGHGAGDGHGPATGPDPQHVSGSSAHLVLVCHATSATEANPWVVTLVDVNSVDLGTHGSHDGDVIRLDLHALPGDDEELETICVAAGTTVQDDDTSGGGDDDGDDDSGDDDDGDDDSGDDGDDDSGDGDGGDDDGGEDAGSDDGGDPGASGAVPGGDPGQTVVPVPAAGEARPPLSIQISTDSVTPEVLGVTTTRIPTGDTVLDASTVEAVTASVTSPATLTTLPVTGASSVQVLGLVGGLLILAGGGLELAARRRRSPLAGAQLG